MVPRFESQGRLLRFYNCDNDNYNYTKQQTVAINQQEFRGNFYANGSYLVHCRYYTEKITLNPGTDFLFKNTHLTHGMF